MRLAEARYSGAQRVLVVWGESHIDLSAGSQDGEDDAVHAAPQRTRQREGVEPQLH